MLHKVELDDEHSTVSFTIPEGPATPNAIGCQNYGDDWQTTEFLYELKFTAPDTSRRSWVLNLNREYSNKYELATEWAQQGTVVEIGFFELGEDIAIAYKEANCEEDSQKLAFTADWFGFKEGDQEGSRRFTSSKAPKSFKIVKREEGSVLWLSYNSSLSEASDVHTGAACYNNNP